MYEKIKLAIANKFIGRGGRIVFWLAMTHFVGGIALIFYDFAMFPIDPNNYIIGLLFGLFEPVMLGLAGFLLYRKRKGGYYFAVIFCVISVFILIAGVTYDIFYNPHPVFTRAMTIAWFIGIVTRLIVLYFLLLPVTRIYFRENSGRANTDAAKSMQDILDSGM